MAVSSQGPQSQVLVDRRGTVRTLTLNRPKQLNALSLDMMSRLLELLVIYEGNPNVKLIILKGHGRAFCAGGDVAALILDIREGDWKNGARYFSKGFTLSYLIATYSKPQVSILNGIVMGAGAAVSIFGRFRIATENTVFAMPETALGLFPDIGTSYFLSRLPGFFGEYVGLTGIRLDGAEMLACGLATHFLPSSRSPMLEAELCKTSSSDPAIISAIIDNYTEQPRLKEESAYNQLDVIDKCFSRRTVEEILSTLEKEVASGAANWVSTAIQSLKKASPTSLKISLRSIREGRLQGIGQCLVHEYRMEGHVLKGDLSKDFQEGCRAMIFDKDRNPKWEPSMLEHVTEAMVDQYFSRLNDDGWEDFKLPSRSSLPPAAIAKL